MNPIMKVSMVYMKSRTPRIPGFIMELKMFLLHKDKHFSRALVRFFGLTLNLASPLVKLAASLCFVEHGLCASSSSFSRRGSCSLDLPEDSQATKL